MHTALPRSTRLIGGVTCTISRPDSRSFCVWLILQWDTVFSIEAKIGRWSKFLSWWKVSRLSPILHRLLGQSANCINTVQRTGPKPQNNQGCLHTIWLLLNGSVPKQTVCLGDQHRVKTKMDSIYRSVGCVCVSHNRFSTNRVWIRVCLQSTKRWCIIFLRASVDHALVCSSLDCLLHDEFSNTLFLLSPLTSYVDNVIT